MSDRPSDQPTSEDLLRRAREEYLTPPPREPARTAPPAAPAAGSSTGDAAPPDAPVEAAGRHAPPPPAGDTKTAAERAEQGTEPEFQIPQGPTPSTRPRRGGLASLLWRFRGIVIPALIFGGILVFNAIDDSKAVDRLEAGDCMLEPDGFEISSVESRSCDEPHQLEVFATVLSPAGDDAPYPGDDAAFVEFFDRCLDRFEGYVGIPYGDSQIYVNTIYPTADSWEEGDRSGSCVLYEPTADGEAVTRTGSLRNARR